MNINEYEIPKNKIDNNLLYNNSNKNSSNHKQNIIIFSFLNFLECFIHHILYLRNVYPQETFINYNNFHCDFLKYIKDMI